MINMLNGSDQIQLMLLQCKNSRVAWVAIRRSLFADHDHDAEEFFQSKQRQAEQFQGGYASRADAGILPLVADVVAARARSRDAAVSSLAAQSWPDRAAMANSASAGGGR